MLALTRKDGESLMIGPDIVIHFTQSRNGKAKIRIEAPDDVTVARTEVLRDVMEEESLETPEEAFDRICQKRKQRRDHSGNEKASSSPTLESTGH